jgi:large subunit ribosomal protein L13
MKDTFVPSKDYITKKWYVIDATDQTLGRLATKASRILVGKEKATYTPYLDR